MPRNALVVEFGGNHSETIGFFISSLLDLEFKVFGYFDGDVSQSFLPDLAPKYDFKTVPDFPTLLKLANRKNFDAVVFNSARNFRRGTGPGTQLFKHLNNAGVERSHIFVQCHAEPDFRLPVVSSEGLTAVGATPLLNRYTSDCFVPLYDGFLNTLSEAVDASDTDLYIVKLGGSFAHSIGGIETKLMGDFVPAGCKLAIFGRAENIENLELVELLETYKGYSEYYKDKSASEIMQQLDGKKKYLWAVNTPGGRYVNRILSGSIPFAINHNIPILIDPDCARIYGVTDPRLIIDPANCDVRATAAMLGDPEVYRDISAKWRLDRMSLIAVQQNAFKQLLKERVGV